MRCARARGRIKPGGVVRHQPLPVRPPSGSPRKHRHGESEGCQANSPASQSACRGAAQRSRASASGFLAARRHRRHPLPIPVAAAAPAPASAPGRQQPSGGGSEGPPSRAANADAARPLAERTEAFTGWTLVSARAARRWRLLTPGWKGPSDGGTTWQVAAIQPPAAIRAGSAAFARVCWLVGQGWSGASNR